MTDIPRRHSTREVRRHIWQVLRSHALPILLMLLLLSLPLIAAGVLDGIYADHTTRAEAAASAALALQEGSPDGMSDAQRSDFIALCSDHARLKGVASACALAAFALLLLSLLLARPLLFGVDLVLITILRGGEFRWRDALPTFGEVRRGFRLHIYSDLCLLMTALPGFILRLLADFIHVSFGLTNLANLIATIGAIIMIVLVFVQLLRFILAPRLLADGAEGTAAELIGQSTEILDLRSLLPMLSILFPGLLMALATLLLQSFVLSPLLPGWLSGLMTTLLLLPAWAWLLTGGAAIYTTFRTE